MAEVLWMQHTDGVYGVRLEIYWEETTSKLTRIFYTNPTTDSGLITIYHPTRQTIRRELPGPMENATWTPNPNQAPDLAGVDVSFRYPASAFPEAARR